MAKYIDAELLKKILKPIEWGTPDERWVPEHEIGAMLDYFPTADVVEVRHGRWIMHIDDLFPAESTMECSQCHEEQLLECDDNYCPNCGAKMDEEENK